MSFEQEQGFYQSNYYDPNADYSGGGGHGQSQDNYGYGQQQPHQYNQGQQGMMPDPMLANAGNAAYSGQIMQPQMQPSYDAPPNDTYSGGFEDEPPLLEELGINFDHISKKTLAVLNPFTNSDPSIVNETDLAGPLVFCLALGATLLLGGKVSFGYIYGIGGIGILAMYILLNLMTPRGVSAGCVASIIGYCILPMVVLSAFSVVLSLKGLLGIILSVVIVGWCSLSASKLFVCGLSMESQQVLVAYPCALLYGVFALLTVF